ncbi:MAG: pentapeptide repeat-containing protein [Bacteriovoracaceae bacterium]|nr:pentapeptide repeat-containing protein [Bacteriovoracaceae bacterium]
MKFFFSLILFLFSSMSHGEVYELGSRGGYVDYLTSIDIQENSYAFTPVGKMEVNGVFSKVILHKTEVRTLKMDNCDFDESDFSRANIANSDIENCVFRNTVFHGTSLKNSKLIHSEFHDSDLSYSDVRGVDFSGTLIGNSNVYGAIFNSKTILPFGHAEALKRGMIYTGN